jgi:two-component system chemotaxis response regulator CheY
MAILVFCEDEPSIQKLIQVALRSTGHLVHIAQDGAAGLALIEAVQPDVIFTDISMPVLDGLGLIDAIRDRPQLGHIPIVVITASVQQAQIEEIYHHGASDHLAKPFSVGELRAKVAHHAVSP